MKDMVTEPPAMEDVVIKLLSIEEERRVKQESFIETITRKTMTVCMNVTWGRERVSWTIVNNITKRKKDT